MPGSRVRPHLCTECGTTEPERFRAGRKSECRECETTKKRLYRVHTDGCPCRWCTDSHGEPSGADLTVAAQEMLYPGRGFQALAREEKQLVFKVARILCWAEERPCFGGTRANIQYREAA